MKADDPRHGTYAGAVAHYAAGVLPCDPCREAKQIYARRHNKERQLGRPRLVSAALLRKHIEALLRSGMTKADIARAAGINGETIRFILGGAEQVNIKTFRSIAAVQPAAESETFMRRDLAARKIGALAAIGHPLKTIATELGMTQQALANILHDYRPHQNRVTRSTWDAINDLYARWHMTPGPSVRAKKVAHKRGWPPPLAFNDIDNPAEEPRDWSYMSTDRSDALRDLVDMGVGITEACNRLHVSRDSLERWCERKGMNDVYLKLAGREAQWENQYTREAS